MAHIVTRGKMHFAVGLSWHIAQDKNDARHILKEEGAGGMRVAIQPDGDDRIWYGLCERLPHEGYAAAAIAAAIFPEVIIATPISDGRVWLCAIAEGMPLPTKDIICDESHWKDELLEWTSLLPSAMIYGDVNGAIGTDEDFWLEVETATASGGMISAKQLRRTRLKRDLTRQELGKIAVGVLIFVGLVLGGWQAFSVLSKTEVITEVVANQVQGFDESKQKEKERKRRIEQAISAHFINAGAAYADLEKALTINPRPWVSLAMGLPSAINGYRPEKISCSGKACEVTWAAINPQLTNNLDKFSLPGIDPASLLSGGVPVSRFDVEEATLMRRTSSSYPPPEGDPEMLKAKILDYFNVDGLSIAVDDIRDVIIPGVPEAGIGDYIAGKTGRVRMVFSGAIGEALFDKLIQELDLHPFAVERYTTMGGGGGSSTELQMRLILISAPPKAHARTDWAGVPAQPVVVHQE